LFTRELKLFAAISNTSIPIGLPAKYDGHEPFII
jgi:hypothetical protein